MDSILDIFEAISAEGFTESTLYAINKHVNDIQNGTADFSRFNLSEHAGLCTAGAPLIGASIVACYATASLTQQVAMLKAAKEEAQQIGK